MTRKPYKLKEEEINTLVAGIMEYGDEETYDRMKNRSLISMRTVDDMDQKLIDMHETVLQRAREADDSDKDGKELKKILYQLASMFRILAHDINREYRKNGKEVSNDRLLHLVSHNEDAPET